MSNEARDLISKLMIRNPMTRLGFNGAQEIKDHAFFRDINWEAFKKRQPDWQYSGIYPPQRKMAKVTKKQIEKAQDAISEIQESGFVSEMQIKKVKIDKWSFVRSD